MSCAAVSVSEDYYAMMDSGTNAIIVPLHPNMCGEIAERRAPSSIVQEPIVQVLDYRGECRLVVALPQSAILISQEWLTTVASWTVIAKSVGTSSQVEAHTPRSRGSPKSLAIKNGFPYLSKDLFWEAMQDISAQTTLVSGHPWPELKELIHEQMQKSSLMVHAVQEMLLTEPQPIELPTQGDARNLH